MSSHRDPNDEAIDWMVALQETPEDWRVRSAFQTWLDSSVENQVAWSEVELTRGALRSAISSRRQGDAVAGQDRAISPVEETQSNHRLPPAPTKASRRTVSRTTAAGITAAIVLLLVSLVGLPELLVRWQADHFTTAAETKTVVLADGSTVSLAGKSAIVVATNSDQRSVELLRGAAYFSVIPDAQRPFTVLSGSLKAKVIGTAFEVRTTVRGGAVAVAQGTVEVSSIPAKSYGSQQPQLKNMLLSAGRSAGIAGNRPTELIGAEVDPASVAAWREGKLIVDDWSVGDVLDALDRYYKGMIVIGSWELSNKRISGVYDLKKPLEAIEVVAATHGFKVRRVLPWTLVVTPF
ncbi:MAG: FecR domain-containing protein [Pseudomonadota bacterium]